MTTSCNLLWLRLRTTKTKAGGSYKIVKNIALLRERDSGGANADTYRDAGTTERWSPVFLVGDRKYASPFETTINGTMWLLYDTKPVELAALIDSKIPAKSPCALFLTYGMASVVLILPDKDPAINPEQVFPDRHFLRAIEQWQVEEGRICKSTVLRDVVEDDTQSIQLPSGSTDSLPETVAHQIQDNNLAMRQVASLCAMYRPSYVGGFEGIRKRLVRLLDELKDPDGTGPLMGRAYSLMHLNSMLSYFVSQGLSGHPPLLEYEGLFPSYALFGVATAYQALWNLTHFIEEGFGHFDILQEMENRYFDTSSENYQKGVFKPVLDGMKPTAMEATPDEHAALGHVNLFSGRLGFHSWAIAAPVHALYASANPDWNLMTLSHEILHVHVGGLLEFVLSRNPGKERKISQDDLYMRMCSLAKQHASGERLSIIDRIRQKIARYVLQSAGCRANDSVPTSELPHSNDLIMAEVSQPSQLREMFLNYWRRLTEYIVHVLDFYYFYNGDVEQSLELIWRSWDRIPSVYQDIGHYVMRSLLSISTREMEPDTGTQSALVEPLTFYESLAAFEEGVSSITALPSPPEVTSKIKEFIAVSENREYLRLEFERAKPLAWVTVMYFYCRPLRLYFEIGRDFPGTLLDDGSLCPEFELGGVQQRVPVSPTAFLSKYLRSDYVCPEDQQLSTEARSLWLFSWLASCGHTEGDTNAS